MNRYQLTKLAKRVGFYALIAVVLVYAIFPFYYAVITSLKPSSELFTVSYWLDSLDLSNYVTIFSEGSFVRAILNSIIVSLSVVFIALLLGITASYALGRVRFRGRGTVMLVILGVSMFPQVAVLSGLFEVIRALNLYNNPGGLILSYTIFTLPFTVWVLTTFMKQLPMELEEAAIMDGATPVSYTHLTLPTKRIV